MSKLIYSLLICILLSSFSRAEAQTTTPDRPDVTSWKVISSPNNISVRISDNVAFNVGLDITYQNPDNKNEFVRQIRFLIPFVTVKSRATMDKNYIDTMIAYTTDGAERDLLKTYLTKSDPILYIRWSVKDDNDRETVKLDTQNGENEVWFWNSSGEWIYDRNIKIKVAYPSETFEDLNNELMIVGVKYSLSKLEYHAREVPYAYISIAVKANKGGK